MSITIPMIAGCSPDGILLLSLRLSELLPRSSTEIQGAILTSEYKGRRLYVKNLVHDDDGGGDHRRPRSSRSKSRRLGSAPIIDYIVNVLADEDFDFGDEGEGDFEALGELLVNSGCVSDSSECCLVCSKLYEKFGKHELVKNNPTVRSLATLLRMFDGMNDEEVPKKKVEVIDGPLLTERDKIKLERRKRKDERQRENFNVSVGGRDLIVDGTVTLSSGRHYGLVGRNGTGKTTFLRTMAMHAIEGIPNNCQILHVEQEVVGDDWWGHRIQTYYYPVYSRRSKKAYPVSLWLDSGLPIGPDA
ncbi:general control non-repressible 3 [Actinidia rufa]|uniref:General control non-repressible 3 n=1 Tax=Actinidia rufa TaxID=165716 RepID=A0A7J0DBB2_9ERIC|nr:general control non-repressible 3 [Actinidia rufa]